MQAFLLHLFFLHQVSDSDKATQEGSGWVAYCRCSFIEDEMHTYIPAVPKTQEWVPSSQGYQTNDHSMDAQRGARATDVLPEARQLQLQLK